MNISDVANQTSQVFFEDYVETTLDPEWSLIIGSLIACILLHATLPCMLSLGSRYERRQEHKRGRRHVGGGGELTDQDETSDEEDPNELKIHSHNNIDDISTKKPRQPSILLERIQSTPEMSTDADIDNVSETKSSKRKKNKNLSRSKKTKVPKMAPIDEENALVADASQILGVTSSWTVSQAAIQRTSRSSGGSPICSGDGVIQWFCGVAETLDRAQLPISRARSSVSLRRRQGSGTKDGVENINKIKKNDSLHSQHQATAIRNVQASDLSQTSSSESRSILSRLHHDDVSFSEAIDKYKNQTITYPTTDNSEIDSGEVDICCGERAWWKPKMIRAALQKLVHVSDIDDEMMALLRTAWPTSAHGFITGLFSLVDISLIGYLVGTKEASVFVLVSLLVWLPTTLTYGLFEALIKFVPESIDHNKMKEAGLYLTTAMGLFSLSMIPIGIFWSFLTKMAFLRLGFDDDFAELAQQYAYIQISIEWLSGIGYCINLFLDIIGHQRFSSYSILVLGFGQTAAIILQTLLGKNSLIYIGLCRSLFASLHVLTTLLLTAWWGWLDKYVSGNSCLPFTDESITLKTIFAAAPLGMIYFLNYGQWEVLTLFVAALGPAEMVAWAIMGYLWSILKYISDGFADAAEGRVALHLVLNNPRDARRSSGKAHFLGFFSSSFVTSILFLIGMELAKAMSPDPTLQRLMIEIFPLIGIGNVVQATASISLSILGAQERAGYAILVQIMGNWGVTMILGTVFTFGFQIDLQGLTSAFVLGLGLSSSGVTYLLLRSVWDTLASRFHHRYLGEQATDDDHPQSNANKVST